MTLTTSTGKKSSRQTFVSLFLGRAVTINHLSPSEFPPIANEQERNNYKREFDRDHQEYKDLQAELDAINSNLSGIDRELDDLQEGSPQYLVSARRVWGGDGEGPGSHSDTCLRVLLTGCSG